MNEISGIRNELMSIENEEIQASLIEALFAADKVLSASASVHIKTLKAITQAVDAMQSGNSDGLRESMDDAISHLEHMQNIDVDFHAKIEGISQVVTKNICNNIEELQEKGNNVEHH